MKVSIPFKCEENTHYTDTSFIWCITKSLTGLKMQKNYDTMIKNSSKCC